MNLKLDMIGVVVSDMAQTLAFYRALGLVFPEGSDAEGHVETTLPGGLRLAFDQEDVIRSFDAGWIAPEGSSRLELAFRCESPAAVDATWADLTGKGFTGHKAPWDAVWGQRYAILHDPAGTSVSLFAQLASVSRETLETP